MRKRLLSVLLALILLTMQLFPALSVRAQEAEPVQAPEPAHCCGTDSELLEEMNSALLKKKAIEMQRKVSPYSLDWSVPTMSDNLMPSTGKVKMLVLPIAYPDYPQMEEEYDEQALYDEYFAEYDPNLKISKQSVRAYYEAMSYGKLKISGEVLPVYKAPETSVYYAKASLKEYPQNGLIKSALEYYVSQGLDLAGYDSDGNGYVDALSVKYLLPTTAVAGGEDWRYWNAQIWALNDTEINGIKADSYLFSGIQDHVSTDEHEIGHLLGLLDNYNTTGACIIDNGLEEMMSCRGYYFNTYYKYLLGWIDPLVLTNGNDIEAMESVNLYATEPYPNNTEAEPKAIILIPDPELLPFTEYFIIEYRNGIFPSMYVNAAFTSNPGIAVWHCNTFVNHTGHLYKSGSKYIEAVKRVGAQETYKKEDAYRKGDIFSSDSEDANSNFKNGDYTGAYMEVLDIDSDKATLKVGFREPDLSPPPTIDLSEPSLKATKATRYRLDDVVFNASAMYNGELLPDKSVNIDSLLNSLEVKGVDNPNLLTVQTKGNPKWIRINLRKEQEGPYQLTVGAGAASYRGKRSREVVSEVFYVDRTPPEVILSGAVPQTVECGDPYSEQGASVTDNLDPDIKAGKLDGKLEMDSSQVNTAKCGTYTVTYTATDHAGNETTVEREVVVQDTTAPTATVSYSTTQPTSGDVIATITPSEPVTVTNTENGSLSYAFTENGSFTFEFEDEAGNKGSITATVSNIDKSLPTGTISYDITGLTNQNVTATLTVDPNITILNNSGNNTHMFTKNGSFEFELQNAAGTKGSVVAAVNWIDKEAPTATVTYSPHKLTNQDVTATITPSEEVTITSEDGLNHTFPENGSFTFEFEDKAGNKGTAIAAVDWIDKEPPVITLLGDNPLSLKLEEEYEEPGVEVTDNRDEEIESRLEIDASAVDIETAGTYTVKYSVTDSAGNLTEATRTVKVEKPGTPTPPTPTPPDPPQPVIDFPFIDVPESSWYYDAVKFMYENGLMAGTGEDTFSPNMTTTRGMIVTILWRLEEKPESTTPMTFADVKPGAYYYEAVCWAAEQGIVKGKSATSFAPDDPVTRQELAAILYRYAQLGGRGDILNGTEILRFPDTGEVADWAKEAMTWTVDQEIISGRGNGFLVPKANSTRAEAASMLMRYCEPASAFQK